MTTPSASQTESTNILGQVYLLKLIGHERASHLINEAIGQNLPAFSAEAATRKGPLITKADLFRPLADGTVVYESAKFWQAFDKVVDILNANGEKLKASDFIQTSGKDNKTMLTCAYNVTEAGQIFMPKVWNGRADEAHELWLHLGGHAQRKAVDIMAARKAIADAAGLTLREDRLKDCEMTIEIIQSAAKTGSLESIDEKLGTFGEHVRKSDLFAIPRDPPLDGDTIFHFESTWKNFAHTLAVLQKHGETFEPEDFLFKRLVNENLLARAIASRHLDKVFLPELWAGRVARMENFWETHVPAAAKDPALFSEWRQAALELQYAKQFQITPQLKLADLFRPINDEAGAPPPLALKAVWAQMESVSAHLAGRGERLTTDMLRVKMPDGQSTFLQFAIQNGGFDQVQQIAAQSQPLTAADLLAPGRTGKTALDDIIAQKKLGEIFKAELWVGRAQEMSEIWLKIPANAEGRNAAQSELSRVSMLSMRQKMAGLGRPRAATPASP